MPRINDPNHARFLTFSTYRRLPLLGTPALRDAFAEQLIRTRQRHEFRLYAWVVMPNHAHLLIRNTGDGDVRAICRTLKLGLSKRVMRR